MHVYMHVCMRVCMSARLAACLLSVSQLSDCLRACVPAWPAVSLSVCLSVWWKYLILYNCLLACLLAACLLVRGKDLINNRCLQNGKHFDSCNHFVPTSLGKLCTPLHILAVIYTCVLITNLNDLTKQTAIFVCLGFVFPQFLSEPRYELTPVS